MRLFAATLLSTTLCLVGCDRDADPEGKASAPAAAKDDAADTKTAKEGAPADAKAKPADEKAPAAAKPGKPDPCAELDEAKLREVAKIASDATVTIEASKFMKTVCDYSWLNAGDTKLFSGKLSIGVTPKPFADEAAATAGFKKALESLSREMTTGGKPPVFEDIADIGDESSWWASFGQLSTRKGDKVVYVTVKGNKDEIDARLALAKAITQAIFAD